MLHRFFIALAATFFCAGVFAQTSPRLLRDFNGDGKPDLVWYKMGAEGWDDKIIWLMNGTKYSGFVKATNPYSQAPIVFADFDGNGRADIVTYQVIDYRQTNPPPGYPTGIVQKVSVNHFVGIENDRAGLPALTTSFSRWFTFELTGNLYWRMAATGDFNGDGAADIVWENTLSGDRLVWFMTGELNYGPYDTYKGYGDIGRLDPEWSIVGAADFNADGQSDLVLQNTRSGDRFVWFMDGVRYTGAAPIGNVDVSWDLAGTGDFDGDGQSDLVWHQPSTGYAAIWLMNGTTYREGVGLPSVGPGWRLISR